jgi:enoyl-CoA hydratase
MPASIKLTVQDYIATVVMDRPPVNAQNSEFRQELITTFDSLTDRDDVRVAILTGTGRMFSAGADMKERPDPEHPGEYWHFNRLARECFNSIAECAKPVIAAVNGPALGAGLGLAASCDIILCSDNAQLGMPEIDVGLAGGAAMLQTLFGRSRARRMFYTGWRVPADELYRTGVVECCVPLEQLMPEAMKVAAEIASKSPIWRALCQAIDEHHHAHAGARRLSLRARHHRHAEQDGGRAGSAPCLHRKAQAGIQGPLT